MPPPPTPAATPRATSLFAVFDKSAGALRALREAACGDARAAQLVEHWVHGDKPLLMVVRVAQVRMVWPAQDKDALAAGLRRLSQLLHGAHAPHMVVAFKAYAADPTLHAHCVDLWMATQCAAKTPVPQPEQEAALLH